MMEVHPSSDSEEKKILEIFQERLYHKLAQEILERNKEKVGKYFDPIHSQSMQLVRDHFSEIVHLFNKYHNTAFKVDSFSGLDKTAVVMHMLKSNNEEFLRALLADMTNQSIFSADDQILKSVRNEILDKHEQYISQLDGPEKKKILDTCEAILKIALRNVLGEQSKVQLSSMIEHILEQLKTSPPFQQRLHFFFVQNRDLSVLHALMRDLKDVKLALEDHNKDVTSCQHMCMRALDRFYMHVEQESLVKARSILQEIFESVLSAPQAIETKGFAP